MSFDSIEPLLISSCERVPRPENPVRDTGKKFFCLVDCILNFTPSGRADRSSAGQVIPFALPAIPSVRDAQWAVREEL